jgi:hypothetical protein
MEKGITEQPLYKCNILTECPLVALRLLEKDKNENKIQSQFIQSLSVSISNHTTPSFKKAPTPEPPRCPRRPEPQVPTVLEEFHIL